MSEKSVCAIVGVGPGIGLALARKFGGEGFEVAMMSRRAKALAQYATTLTESGVGAHAYPADAGDPASLAAAFKSIRETLGHPTVLVYNAAALHEGSPTSLTPETLIEEFGINVAGALVSVQQVVSEMRAAGTGTILFTGGGLSIEPYPAYASLALGKAALRSLGISLAKDLEEHGIHVATVTICGFVEAGSLFDPDAIAYEYWRLHAQAPGEWEREAIFQPSASDPDYNAPGRR